MKKVIISISIGIMILAVGCGQNTNKTESIEENGSENAHNHGDHDQGNSEKSEEREFEATNVKNASTSEIIDAYLKIKNALVADNDDGAAKGATALLGAFSNFDMTELTESQHEEYMEIVEDAKEHSEHIMKSPIDHQREHFEVLSIDINDLVALIGTDKTLYEDFCPMANDGKGAIWFSETKEIENPFFGSKMLKCGKVQSQIN